MNLVLDIFNLLIWWFGIAVAVFLLMRLLFSYRLSETDVEINLLHKIPVMKVPYKDIKEIYRPSLTELFTTVFAWHCENKFYYNRVLIKRGYGVFPDIFVTPDNPDNFIEQVKRRLRK